MKSDEFQKQLTARYSSVRKICWLLLILGTALMFWKLWLGGFVALVSLFLFFGLRSLKSSQSDNLEQVEPLIGMMVIGNSAALAQPGARVPAATLAGFPPYELSYLTELKEVADLLGSLYAQDPTQVPEEFRQLCELINDDAYQQDRRRSLPAEFLRDHDLILFDSILESRYFPPAETDDPFVLLATSREEGAPLFHAPGELMTAPDGLVYVPRDPNYVDYSQREARSEIVPASPGSHSEAVGAHLEKLFRDEITVYHELVSDLIHLDVYIIAAAVDRPWITLVTAGMSDLPMLAPDGEEHMTRSELMLRLPADWPMGEAALEDEENYWPVRALKFLARLPHEYDSWLSYGHTIPNGHPAEPFADDIPFTGVVLGPPDPAMDGISPLRNVKGEDVYIWSVIPLHPSEMEHKLQHGADALFDKLRGAGVWDLVDKQRPAVV